MSDNQSIVYLLVLGLVVCVPMMWAFHQDEKMYRDIREIWRKFDER